VILSEMGFKLSRVEDDIWMRKVWSIYEFIARHADDLAIASKDPSAIVEELTTKHKLKLNGSVFIAYHLGADFYRDKDGVLCVAARIYVEGMRSSYVTMFGTKSKQIVNSPLEKGNLPELDVSEVLDIDNVKVLILDWITSVSDFIVGTLQQQ